MKKAPLALIRLVLVLSTVASMNNLEDKHYVF